MDNEKENLEIINRTVKNLYNLICLKRGQQPDWEKFKNLFFPGAKLISNSGDYPDVCNIDEFISIYEDRLAEGTIEEFCEYEIFQKTEIFGKIAHRFSTYEAVPFKRGINSIQLMQVKKDWLIYSIIWNDETDNLKIPDRYLG